MYFLNFLNWGERVALPHKQIHFGFMVFGALFFYLIGHNAVMCGHVNMPSFVFLEQLGSSGPSFLTFFCS